MARVGIREQGHIGPAQDTRYASGTSRSANGLRVGSNSPSSDGAASPQADRLTTIVVVPNGGKTCPSGDRAPFVIRVWSAARELLYGCPTVQP